MDFDRYLTKIQSSLRCIEVNLNIKLVDLTREKNEDIDAMVQLFSTFLKELNPDEDNLRKINLYLLINSDFPSTSLLQNDVNLCHLFNISPKLTTLVYFELMQNTALYKYIGEIIMFCPEVLVVDVVKCLSVNIRYCNADSANHLLYLIYDGMYHRILELHKQTGKENIIQKFVKIFQHLFEFSIFDVIEKTDWDLERRRCYFGRYIKMILNLIEKCVQLFNSKQFCPTNELYTMKIDFDYKNWCLQSNEQNWPVYCLQIMISKCKKLLQEISVNIYMSLCEEDDGDTGKTLQTAVRESAYTCRECLQTLLPYENKIVDLSFLINGLNNIALKPKSEDDEFPQAVTDTIARNMKDPNKTRYKWLQSYLNIDDILLENRCIDDLTAVTDIFTRETTVQLISLFSNYLKSGSIQEKQVDSYKEIIVSCVKKLKMEDQMKVLEAVTNTSLGSDLLKRKQFNQNVIETLNKIVNKNDNMEIVLHNVIILALESGRELVSFLIADCLKGAGLCDLLIKILLDVPVLTSCTVSTSDPTPLCLHLVVQHFNQAIQTGLEERDNLIYMIKRFSWHNIINGKDFIVDHLIPTIQTSVPGKQWRTVDICLDVLSVFIDGSGGGHVIVHDVEIIAFLAQLLNRSRQQPPQFTDYSGRVVQKAFSSLFTLTNSFLQNRKDKTDKDGCWLREITKSMSPLTWFPMRKLWTSCGLDLPPDPNNMLTWSKQYLGRQDLLSMNEVDRGQFVIQLCKVLPLLCQSEWTMIGYQLTGADRAEHCVAVYHIIADSLLVLNQLPVVVGNIACSAHLVSGFTGFFKGKVIHALKHCDRDACLSVLNKQVILINDLSVDVVNVRLPALVTVLQDITDIIINKSKELLNSDLLTIVATINKPQIQSMLSNRLIKTLSA